MSYYIASTVFRASVPILLNTSFISLKDYFRSKPCVPRTELVDRVAKLDLRSKLELYESVLEDIRDTMTLSDMIKVAIENVQEILLKINDLLSVVEVNLGMVRDFTDRKSHFDSFFFVTKKWYDKNEEEMIQTLTMYNTLLSDRYNALVSVVKLQLSVQDHTLAQMPTAPVHHARDPLCDEFFPTSTIPTHYAKSVQL